MLKEHVCVAGLGKRSSIVHSLQMGSDCPRSNIGVAMIVSSARPAAQFGPPRAHLRFPDSLFFHALASFSRRIRRLAQCVGHCSFDRMDKICCKSHTCANFARRAA